MSFKKFIRIGDCCYGSKRNQKSASKLIQKNSGIISEFKQFISRGNVIDMAVGIIIGSAFTSIVTSLVADIVTPILETFLAGINFNDVIITIPWGSEPEIAIGSFFNAIVRFFIIAICVFLIVKSINKFSKKEETPSKPEKPSEEVLLLTEIRDLLSKNPGPSDQSNQ